MTSKKKLYYDEIDLIELIIIVWNKKIKIFLFTALAMIISYLHYTSLSTNTIAKTEIRPITSFEESKYADYNLYLLHAERKREAKEFIARGAKNANNINQEQTDVIKVDKYFDKSLLQNLFVEKLNERIILIDALKKFEFLNKENYKNQLAFDKAIEKLSYKIKIYKTESSLLSVGKNEKKIVSQGTWVIQFETNNKEKWQNVLNYVEKNTNQEVQKYIITTFDRSILNKRKIIKFQIEDKEEQIKKALIKYELDIKYKLSFLEEQAAIARRLSIAKNTLDIQTSSTESGMVTNFQTEMPYYMRGYEMIEKEIELILNRSNKEAFTENMSKLQNDLITFKSDKTNQRVEELFYSTPISEYKKFHAAHIKVLSTNYVYKNRPKSILSILIIGCLLGAIFGIIYVLIEKAVQNRR
jgi:LPS O-antigen subunit length determinant protein (WzzB/FepE family)